VLLVLNS
jgi:hypothetical protein